MSWEATAKIALLDTEHFMVNLLKRIQGTEAAQHAETAGVDTLKGIIETALAPYVGPLDPELNVALDAFAALVKSKIVDPPGSITNPHPVSST